ncbi:MAG: hypothetical protein MJZ69_10730 [Bacteroidaceae bacterium]|nr:hypothetical protein [Bacteroidaceae bacterium]
MIQIHNRFIPFKGYKAINLFGLCFVRKGMTMLSSDIRHEQIHTAQLLECLIIFFYPLYLLEWIFKLIKYRNANQAYRAISFEREAYNNQCDKHYLTTRKHYCWVKWLLK